jgi:hypothetical protein
MADSLGMVSAFFHEQAKDGDILECASASWTILLDPARKLGALMGRGRGVRQFRAS